LLWCWFSPVPSRSLARASEADPPGSVFVELIDKSTMVIELNDKSAIVAQPPSNRATATISKPDSNLSEEAAAAMARADSQ
jgi:hypothetical protein